jgi:hypothetical protein
MMDKYKFFIDNLKRDKARGNLAPHQIILLISFINLDSSFSKNQYNIDELIKEFDANWNINAHFFATKNNNIGMPLKALLNKNLIEIKTNEVIINYRNRNEISLKVGCIKLSQELMDFLNSVDVKYLEKRIIN